jgi:hypothetical protein
VQFQIAKRYTTYLNVPKASSTTSRVSSLNNLIKPATTPLESNNLRFASLDITKLEIHAAAQPLSVASGDDSYYFRKNKSIVIILNESHI